ncbi:MAG: response regulator [Mucilaginibacter sp.]|uniref:response regulator n=1 Tax=Mucilaginibacter sp. TaxID=1882438 RepID=UPI003266A25A
MPYRNKTILLIDDNEDIRESTAELLQLSGFHTHIADSGKTGLVMAIELQPDLVICDIVMSEMDGYEVYNSLKQNHLTAHICLLFSTAKAEDSDRLRAEKIGVHHYLVKPFDEDELIRCIRKCLGM